MPVPAEIYNIMLSSPSDMQKEREKITEAIASWNQKFGLEYRVFFRVLRYEEDILPIVNGKDGQTNINEQLCNKSDIALVFFGKKLGTPTKHYPSGTIEEINIHLKQNKPVFLFFAKNQGENITGEYQRLLNYKIQMQSNCCYREFNSPQELCDIVIKTLKTHISSKKFHDNKYYLENPSLMDFMWEEMKKLETFLQYQIDNLAEANLQNSISIAETREIIRKRVS